MGAFSQVTTSSGATISFGGAPTNGHIVAVGIPINVNPASIAVKDSNSVALTQGTIYNAASAAWALIYWYVVSGSPTATFTASGSGSGGITQMTAWEMSGVTTATFNGATGTGPTTVATNAGVLNGDCQVVIARDNNNFTPTIAFSNGSTTTDSTGGAFVGGHAVATSTASSTITETSNSSGQPVAVAYGTFSAGGGGGSTYGDNPGMGVKPGGMPGLP